MLARLTFKQKKILLIGAMLLVCYIAYQFSFKPAIVAIKLNNELRREQVGVQNLDQSVSQIERTNGFYKEALKTFYVKAGDRENKLWQAVSGMALAKTIEISFGPNPQLALDTTQAQYGIVHQQFIFKGNYFNLVKLLDTISKSKGIGKISALRLGSIKRADGIKKADLIVLKLTLSAIER